MGSFTLNIPEAFRTSFQLSRESYQPIDDQSTEAATRCSKFEIATTVVGSFIVLSGFIFLCFGFLIPGLVLVLTIPVLGCIYSQLYDLDARECCICLKGICCCCFKLFDLQATPGEANHQPYVFDPYNVEIASRDSPPSQIVFSEPSSIEQAVKIHFALERQAHADDLTPATIISQKTNTGPQISDQPVPGPSNLVPMIPEGSIEDSFETAASMLDSFETVASSLGSVETSFISQNVGHSVSPRNEESFFKTNYLKEAPLSPAMDVLTLESLTAEKAVYGTPIVGGSETETLFKKPVSEPLNVEKIDPKSFDPVEPTLKTIDTEEPADTIERVPTLVDTKEPTLQSSDIEKSAYNEESAPLPDDAEESAPLPDDAELSAPLPDDAELSAPLPDDAELSAPLPDDAELSAPLPDDAELSAPLPDDAELSASLPDDAETKRVP